MPSGLSNKLARIFRMDRVELKTRAEQEFHKRTDLLKYRLGAQQRVQFNPDSPRGKFFVDRDELPERARMVRKYLPEEAAKVLSEADGICHHRFSLLGYEKLEFATRDRTAARGNSGEIDWHLDPVHGKRAPLVPWFKIPFLAFAAVGDHKVIWELNRHQHLVTLAKARVLSGDEKYARELIAQWQSWTEANPYPLGINWGSTLEVAFRSLSWIWVDHLLPAGQYTEFRAELLTSLAFHGHYIERYLSTYFSPNTHLLGEAVALFFLGTLYPKMPRAARWKNAGWQIVLNEARRQVRPDGVYFEQSLYYHVYALDFFLHARLLAAKNNIEIPPAFDTTVERMLEVIEALAQSGPPEGFGDDDGGRLWNPRRNRTEHMADPLAVGAVTYSKEFSAARLTEEAIWLFGTIAVEKLGAPRNTTATDVRPADVKSQAFLEGGLYVLTDSHPYPQAMIVDAGPQGTGRSGHGHADALSLRLTMDHRRWLVDSGSGVYISSNPADRNAMRGTAAHNTVIVDKIDQAIPDQPFSWTHIPTVQGEEWIAGKTFTYFVGSHNGYERLSDPVTHRRHVIKIAGGIFLVRDVLLGHAEHELDIRWHFAPDLEVKSIRPGYIQASAPGSAPVLNLLVPENTPWQQSLELGITSISPAYGAFQPAPLLQCPARILLPAETAVLLQPFSVALSPDSETWDVPRFVSIEDEAVHSYEFQQQDELQQFFFALGDHAWRSGPWSSDARVFYCRLQKGKLASLIVVGGTHLRWQGEPLLAMRGTSPFFEWDKLKNVMHGSTQDFSVTSLLEQLAAGTEPTPSGPGQSPVAPATTFAEKH